jgi:putative ABC transport system permease protein
MQHDFYLAWRYLRHHKTRTLILIACLSLLSLLPLALHLMLDEGGRQMDARAASTPLLVGAKGSAVDLTLNALYFNESGTSPITMAEADRIAETGWADPLPIYARFRVQGHPLVGVSLDYFDFRQLATAQGAMLALLGECVLGADAAEDLGLQPGDTLLTTPENLFDLAGVYPLKLHVVGVLGKVHSPDDQAVFIDLKTAWVIDGLGHGHAGAKPTGQQTALFAGAEAGLAADAKLLTYTEITPDNIDSFHFHGDPASYPITAVIAAPPDRKSYTLLRGRYVDPAQNTQIVQPLQTIRGLLQNIFRLQILFDAVLALVGGAALLALGLVFSLSLRLRQKEIQTIFLLGCSRLTMARLVGAEIVLIVLASAAVCMVLLQPVQYYAGALVRRWIMP